MKPFFTEIEKKAKTATQPTLKKLLIDFYKQTFQWIGQAIIPFVDKLKKVHIKELKAYFDSYKQVDMIPKRGKNEKSTSFKVDTYDLVDAVDIFKKFDEGWSMKVLKIPLKKWKEKTSRIQELAKAAS